jgi:hypothetical protein
VTRSIPSRTDLCTRSASRPQKNFTPWFVDVTIVKNVHLIILNDLDAPRRHAFVFPAQMRRSISICPFTNSNVRPAINPSKNWFGAVNLGAKLYVRNAAAARSTRKFPASTHPTQEYRRQANPQPSAPPAPEALRIDTAVCRILLSESLLVRLFHERRTHPLTGNLGSYCESFPGLREIRSAGLPPPIDSVGLGDEILVLP